MYPVPVRKTSIGLNPHIGIGIAACNLAQSGIGIGKDPDHIEVVSVEVMNLENDNSVASADNEVPDIQDAPQQDLNFLA